MAHTDGAPLRSTAIATLFAGLLGSTTYLVLAPMNGLVDVAPYLTQVTAVTLRGIPLGATSPLAAGAMIHALICLVWAAAYVGLARSNAHLTQAPLIAGLAFGLVVELMMDGLLVMVGAYHLPSPSAFFREIAAYTLGFGIPVALMTSAVLRTRAPISSTS